MVDLKAPTTERELIEGIGNGTIRETHHIEVKEAANNAAISATLASLAIDGGVFILGIGEEKDDRGTKRLVPKPHPLSGLLERVDGIARNSVEPPLGVRSQAIPSEADPTVGYLTVSVTASALAPHMAGNRYYGRNEASKHALSDADVLRFHQRRQHLADMGERLLAQEEERDYIPVAGRQCGHIYLVAEPHTPFPRNLVRGWQENIVNFLSWYDRLAPEVSPSPTALTTKVHRSAGTAAVTHEAAGDGRKPRDGLMGAQIEKNLLDVEITNTGGLRIFIGRGTGGRFEEGCVTEFMAIAYVRHLLTWAAHMTSEANYGGAWTIGVRANGLRGLKSSRANQGSLYIGVGSFDTEEYSRVEIVTSRDITEASSTVFGSLLHDYLRVLGYE